MQNKLNELFNNFQIFDSNFPIVKGKLPELLMNEINLFVNLCKDIESNPLSFLKNHLNAGKNSNQFSVPIAAFEDSFIFAYLNHLGSFSQSLLTQTNLDSLYRKIIIRRNYGHFDHYDFWVNFTKIGDSNPKHSHAGVLSGIIYVTETNLPTNFFILDRCLSYMGLPGEILIFPSNLEHNVDINTEEKERITLSFNLDLLA